MKPLTAKQIDFAFFVADGLTASEAYRRVYSANGKATVRHVRAHEVRHHPAVAAFIGELQEEVRRVKLAEREDKRRLLALIMFDREEDTGRRLEAIKIDNLMTGDNSPLKVEPEAALARIFASLQPSTGLFTPEEIRSLEIMGAEDDARAARNRAVG